MPEPDRSESILGKRARDAVTGFEGIITERTDFLGGSSRVCITARALLDGKVNAAAFELGRVELQIAKRRMGFGNDNVPMEAPDAA